MAWIEQAIRKFSNSDFNLVDSRFPKGICNTCKVVIHERNRGNSVRCLPQMLNYLDIQLLRETRNSGDQECFCFICKQAKQTRHKKTMKGRGHKKQNLPITVDNGLNAAKKPVELKTSDSNPVHQSSAGRPLTRVEICKICFADITIGKTHMCVNYNNVQQNVVSKIVSLPERVQDNILHKLLVAKAKTSNSTEDLRNVEMNLKTGGRNARVTLNPHEKKPYDSDSDEPPSKKKRSTYDEGGSLGRKSNLNGVNRLILLCVVPDIKETYENVRILWNLTNLNKIPHKFVSDYKLLLIIIGQQTATSTYPCPFCFVTLETLRSGECGKQIPCSEEGSAAGLHISEECLKLKTFGDIKENHHKFSNINFDKRFAKTFHSTVNLPLFEEPDDMPVIEKAVIPELHEIQGIVNHVFFDGLVPILGRENALKWPKKLNLISKNYHGEKFEGNACRRLLKESDKLNDKDVLQETPTLKIAELLKALDKLVNASFKSERLNEEWHQHLTTVKRIFPATNLSFTLKIYVLLEHLEHGIHYLNGNSLGMWSEQAGESVHREFLKYWSKYQRLRMADRYKLAIE
ncbi:hypothetical protein Bhyg_03918 [Pseudolycoriella hygida]|uniref:Uncharacterized protein n=1 Tax=Pseudolycoriella hygida TaxID=35572 RepID=A0A9Q0NEX5_9DIPT|nr:hypothetical protein Bhyg_03918 [Pseudolycoriella hygida]